MNRLHLGVSSEATFAVDDQGTIVSWNAAAEKLLGYSAKQAVGAQCHDLMHGVKPSGAPMCTVDCPVVEFCKHGVSARRFQMLLPVPGAGQVCVDVTTVIVYDASRPVAVHVVNECSRKVPALTMTLTARELDVLRLLAKGIATPEIASSLMLSRATVRNHVQSVIAKLGVHSRVEAVVFALQSGIVQTH